LVRTSVVSSLLTGSDSTVAVHSALVWLLVQVLSVSFLMTMFGSAVATSLVWIGLVLFLVHLDLPGISIQGLERVAPSSQPIGHERASIPSTGPSTVPCSGIASAL
jgi:hypothetical protein